MALDPNLDKDLREKINNITGLGERLTEVISNQGTTALAEGSCGRHQLLIRDALFFIDRHYSEKITLRDVADSVQLSPNYFSWLFRKECNCTFIAYLRYKRISAACELLQNTQLSVGKVAERVGYTNVSHFNELFKKITGMSPGKYRESSESR